MSRTLNEQNNEGWKAVNQHKHSKYVCKYGLFIQAHLIYLAWYKLLFCISAMWMIIGPVICCQHAHILFSINWSKIFTTANDI